MQAKQPYQAVGDASVGNHAHLLPGPLQTHEVLKKQLEYRAAVVGHLCVARWHDKRLLIPFWDGNKEVASHVARIGAELDRKHAVLLGYLADNINERVGCCPAVPVGREALCHMSVAAGSRRVLNCSKKGRH